MTSYRIVQVRYKYCYKPLPSPLFFLIKPVHPTPVTTQLTLPITSDLSEEDIANALEQLYTNLTHFLTMHHCTPNSNLLSHQLKPHGAHPIGSLPHPHSTILPSDHHCSCHKDITPPPLDLYLDLHIPSNMDSLPKIVTLPDWSTDLILWLTSDRSPSYHHIPDHYI
jgi:hypothetical protein